MKPTQVLARRMRFTTKQVARGFYRGNNAASVGAHTQHGKYVVDWRKTTHYNVPDLTGFELSPFVTEDMPLLPYHSEVDGKVYRPPKVDGLEFLRLWKRQQETSIHNEYETLVEHQRTGGTAQEQEPVDENSDLTQYEDPFTGAQASQSIQKPRNPMHQQHTRQMHTTPRRRTTAELESTKDLPPLPEWLDMSRQQQKDLINAATTQELRRRRKENVALAPGEKAAVKLRMKQTLKMELIGSGILRDEAMYAHIMSLEARRRQTEGSGRWTASDKEEFKQEFLHNLLDGSPAQRKEYVAKLLA